MCAVFFAKFEAASMLLTAASALYFAVPNTVVGAEMLALEAENFTDEVSTAVLR